MPISSTLFTAFFLGGILITWSYEFYVISDVVAPPNFKPFKTVAAMVESRYRIGYLEDDWGKAFRDEIMQMLARIMHDPNKILWE